MSPGNVDVVQTSLLPFLPIKTYLKKKKDLRIGPVQVVDVSSGKKSKTLLANVM